jgi:hypothetical protein
MEEYIDIIARFVNADDRVNARNVLEQYGAEKRASTFESAADRAYARARQAAQDEKDGLPEARGFHHAEWLVAAELGDRLRAEAQKARG